MQKSIEKKRKRLIILTIIAISLISFVLVFARYVTNNITNFFLRSKEFYFYSDKLSEKNSVYQVNNWSGVDDYVITINMNSRENNIEVSSCDIGYEIEYTCTDNAICQISKTQGIIYATNNADFFNLTITPNAELNEGDKVEVIVKVHSTYPYKKTLSGKFTLVVGKEKLSYEITDKVNDPYMTLRMTNTLPYYNVKTAFGDFTVGQKIDINTYMGLSETEKANCYSAIVTVKFNPRDVLFDMTSDVYRDATDIKTTTLDGVRYVNELTIPILAISSREIRFYKVDVTKDYTYPYGNQTSIVTVTSI